VRAKSLREQIEELLKAGQYDTARKLFKRWMNHPE